MTVDLLGAGWLAFVAVAFILGLLVGSFLNVVIHRLPRGESIVRPRSRCPSCGEPIPASSNVPLLSYLWLRGRCGSCDARISLRYPAVELLTGCVFLVLALRFGLGPEVFVWMVFSGLLLAAGAIDIDFGIIPDEISLGGLAVGLLAMPALKNAAGVPLGAAIFESVLGAFLGAFVLWSVGFIHARISAALGREFPHWPGEGQPPPRFGSFDYWIWFPGIGFGDVKLLAMVGAFMGALGVLETVIAASLLGLGMGLVLAMRRGVGAPFGFGPAIAAGAFVVLLVPGSLLLLG